MHTVRLLTACASIVSAILAISFLAQVTVLRAAIQPATTQSSPQIDGLIKLLGSDDADDRDAAQNHLVDLGAAAIAALKNAAEKNDDPEIRSRAAAAIHQMKDHDENDASFITLHRNNAPASDVLDEIGRQSHAQFMGLEPGIVLGNNQNLTVDVDHKPFWDVMSSVCLQLNICPMLETSGRGLMRLYTPPRNWMAGPHQIVGPYWIGISRVDHTIDMMGPPTTDDQFSVRMIVYAEPKLTITQKADFTLKKAVDDVGNSLMLPSQRVAPLRGMRSARMTNHMLDTQLAYPANPGKKISLLSGELAMLVGQDIQQFQMENVLSNPPKIINPLKNCTVRAGVGRQGADVFRVTIQCTRQQGLTDEQWNAMVDRMNDLTLEDAAGHQLYPATMSLNVQATESAFTAIAIFTRMSIGPAGNGQLNKVGEPSRLTWNVATRLKSVTVPVTFKDLPMP